MYFIFTDLNNRIYKNKSMIYYENIELKNN